MEYMSLYDYLGRAAGQELGAKVNAYARERNVVSKQRSISNPRYKGTVHLYPTELLDEYFKSDMIMSKQTDSFGSVARGVG
jgi:hypothetical protein